MAYFSLPSEPIRYAGLGMALLSGIIWVIAGRYLWRPARLCFIALVLLCVGFELGQSRTWRVAGPILGADDRPRLVTGQILHVSFLAPSGYKAIIRPLSIERVDSSQLPNRIRVTIRSKHLAISPGDWISLLAVVGPPPGPVSPGAFDFRRMYWFDGIGGMGFAVGKARIIEAETKNTWVEETAIAAARFRANLTRRVQAALPNDDGAVASALLTGERAAIAKEHLQALRDSGLAHLLAISGLHMGLAGFGIYFALRFLLSLSETLTLRYPIKKWAAGAALLGILFYLIASGMAVSAQRAFIMTGVVFVAIMLDRSAITLRTVAIAASVMIFLTPEVVAEAGFQMSFAAVICLVSAYEFFRSKNMFQEWRSSSGMAGKFVMYAAGIAMTSFVASLATSPMAAYHFHRVVHYSILADLVAMPLMGFVVMPSAILSFLAMPLGAEHLPLAVMGWGIRQILNVGQYVSSIPGAVTGVPAWPPIAFGLIILGGLWLCIWRERWRLLGVPVMALGLAVGIHTDQPDILVSEDGRQVMYRSTSGEMIAIDARRRRFQTEAWLRRMGDLRPLKAATVGSRSKHRCDAKGCIARLPSDRVLAISKNLGSLREDCLRADIVVSVRPIRTRCSKPTLVIDRFDLWRNGSYAIWLRHDEIIHTTTKIAEKDRPWTRAAMP